MRNITETLEHCCHFIYSSKLVASSVIASTIMSYYNAGNLPKLLHASYAYSAMPLYITSLICYCLYVQSEDNSNAKKITDFFIAISFMLSAGFAFNHFVSVAFTMMPANLYTKIASPCAFYAINNLTLFCASYLDGTDQKECSDNNVFFGITIVSVLSTAAACAVDFGISHVCSIRDVGVASNAVRIVGSILITITTAGILDILDI